MAVVEKTKVYILEYPSKDSEKKEKFEMVFSVSNNTNEVDIRYLIDGEESTCTLGMHNGKMCMIPSFYSVEEARTIWKKLVKFHYFHSNP